MNAKQVEEVSCESLAVEEDAGAILLRVRCKLFFLSSALSMRDSNQIFEDNFSASGFGWILEGIAGEIETAENKLMPHAGRGKGAV